MFDFSPVDDLDLTSLLAHAGDAGESESERYEEIRKALTGGVPGRPLVFLCSSDDGRRGSLDAENGTPGEHKSQLKQMHAAFDWISRSCGHGPRAVNAGFADPRHFSAVKKVARVGDWLVVQESGVHSGVPQSQYHAIAQMLVLAFEQGLRTVICTTYNDGTVPIERDWCTPLRRESMNDAMRRAAQDYSESKNCHLFDAERYLRTWIADLGDQPPGLVRGDGESLTPMCALLYAAALYLVIDDSPSADSVADAVVREGARQGFPGASRLGDFASNALRTVKRTARHTTTASYGLGNDPIHVLVTTFSAVLHVSLHPQTLAVERVKVLHEGSGVYYGATWGDGNYYVLARNDGKAPSRNEILVFDCELKFREQLRFGGAIKEGHQIRYIDDAILVCNTNYNCLSKVTISDAAVEHMYPLSGAQGANINHFNSVSLYGNRLWLVAANRFRNSFFMCFDYPSMKLLEVDAVGLSAHNLVEWNGWRVSCDSYHGALTLIRPGFDGEGREYPMHSVHLLPDTNEVVFEKIIMGSSFFRERRGAPAFPRGLAIAGNIFLVGISELTKRSMRNESLSRLMLIDEFDAILEGRKPGRVHTAELGCYGAVMDVRVLNREDSGHAV